jgi:hypothetical protein
MAVVMKNNYIFVQPGEKAFKVASNYTNYVELGQPGITDYALQARVQDDEFVINADFVDPEGRERVNVAENVPQSSGLSRRMLVNGYRIEDEAGRLVLGLEVLPDDVCVIRGAVYDSRGDVVAESRDDDFIIHRGPAVIGKSGDAQGIVLD